jgi:hypothetical protein
MLLRWCSARANQRLDKEGEHAMTAKPAAKKWSKNVTEHSDALDLERGVFAQPSAKKIASSLKASAEHSERRKSSPFRSAMSMLNFYINRAGSKISATRKKRLEDAKDELRQLFDHQAKASANSVKSSERDPKSATKRRE